MQPPIGSQLFGCNKNIQLLGSTAATPITIASLLQEIINAYHYMYFQFLFNPFTGYPELSHPTKSFAHWVPQVSNLLHYVAGYPKITRHNAVTAFSR